MFNHSHAGVSWPPIGQVSEGWWLFSSTRCYSYKLIAKDGEAERWREGAEQNAPRLSDQVRWLGHVNLKQLAFCLNYSLEITLFAFHLNLCDNELVDVY
ncbi:hypothetical protein ACJBU6_00204 [Exserohilum turcicum]